MSGKFIKGKAYTWIVIDPKAPEPIEVTAEQLMIHLAPPAIEIPAEIEIPAIPEFAFYGLDSIPGFDMRLREPIEFEEFEREFTQKFKSQFKEFYEKNEFQFQKMFEEAKRNERQRREALEVVDLEDLARIHEDMANLAEFHALEGQKMMVDNLQRAQIEMINDQVAKQQLMADDMQRQTEAYKEALLKMLKEDGYVNGKEDLDNLSINDNNGDLTINGHKIKEKDVVKYRALRDTYFGNYKKRYSFPGRSE